MRGWSQRGTCLEDGGDRTGWKSEQRREATLLSQGTPLHPQPWKNGGGKGGYGKAVGGDGSTVVTVTTLRLLDFHVEICVANLREWPG